MAHLGLAQQGIAPSHSLALSHFDGQLMRRDRVEVDPSTWLMEFDGLLVDVRHAPVDSQVRAFHLGTHSFATADVSSTNPRARSARHEPQAR